MPTGECLDATGITSLHTFFAIAYILQSLGRSIACTTNSSVRDRLSIRAVANKRTNYLLIDRY